MAKLAMLLATVPFNVGTQVLGVLVIPASGEHEDEEHMFDAIADWLQVPVALHVPPHWPTAQDVPLGATGLEHVPVEAEHEPATWQLSLAVHVTGFDPTHVPLVQTSVWVHPFESLHAVPFVATGFVHAPVVLLQLPAAWH